MVWEVLLADAREKGFVAAYAGRRFVVLTYARDSQAERARDRLGWAKVATLGYAALARPYAAQAKRTRAERFAGTTAVSVMMSLSFARVPQHKPVRGEDAALKMDPADQAEKSFVEGVVVADDRQ